MRPKREGSFQEEKVVKPSLRYIAAGYAVLILAAALTGKAQAGNQLASIGGAICKGASSCLMLQLD